MNTVHNLDNDGTPREERHVLAAIVQARQSHAFYSSIMRGAACIEPRAVGTVAAECDCGPSTTQAVTREIFAQQKCHS